VAIEAQEPPGDPGNPVFNRWSQVWTPASYTPRIVTFSSEGIPDLPADLWISVPDPKAGQFAYAQYFVLTEPTQFQVAIVPEPAFCGLLLSLALIRRRRACSPS